MKAIMLNTKNRKNDFDNLFKLFFDEIINAYIIHNVIHITILSPVQEF